MKNYTIESEDELDDMEMPVPCQVCSSWFDLNDGYSSEKLRNTVICKKCYYEERAEIERTEEIEDMLTMISDAEWTIKDCKERLITLGYKFDSDGKQ